MKSHDPMCPCFGGIGPEDWPDTRVCQCDLIARVRANEKAKWTHVCPDNNCCNQPGDI